MSALLAEAAESVLTSKEAPAPPAAKSVLTSKEAPAAKDDSSSDSKRKSKSYRKKEKHVSKYCLLSDFAPSQDEISSLRRGGSIFYTAGAELEFCFGLDRQFSEYTDFGGSFDPLKDSDIVDTALRELKEESLGLLDLQGLRKALAPISVVVYGAKDLTLFIPVTLDRKEFNERFEEAISLSKKSEMKGNAWFSKEEMVKNFTNGKMYKKISRLISNAGPGFYEVLK